MRMRVPEAFRCQDMTHQDVIFLTRRFLSSSQGAQKPLAVIGIRTAGAYFAPLTKAFLSSQGWPQWSVFTIRPGKACHSWKDGGCGRITARMRVLLVDDYQNRGRTMRMRWERFAGLTFHPRTLRSWRRAIPRNPMGPCPLRSKGWSGSP